MTSKVIDLPRATPLSAGPSRTGFPACLSSAVQAVARHARRLLDRIAGTLGYSRFEQAAFERWLAAPSGRRSDQVPRRHTRPARLIDFEAARAARVARRS
jgi:hypothetical protein